MAKASLRSAPLATAYDALDKTMMSEDPPWAPMFNRTQRGCSSPRTSRASPTTRCSSVDYAAVCKK